MGKQTVTAGEIFKILDQPIILAQATVEATKSRKLLSHNPATRNYSVTYRGETYETPHGDTAMKRYNDL